jgi:hypothetical protein
MILNTLRRESINTAREALHGARSPSRRTPESKKTLGMVEGLPLAIKTPEAAPAYFSQVIQSLIHRYASSSQRVPDTLTKAKKGNVRGYNHQCLTKLNEQDLASLRELVQFAILGRNCDPALFTDSDCFNWPSLSFWHETQISFVNISRMRVTRATVSCK